MKNLDSKTEFHYLSVPQNLKDLGLTTPLPDHWWIHGKVHALNLLNLLPQQGLCIVGTRSPDRKSLFWLETLFEELSEYSVIIVSGLARGIDQHAHGLALKYKLPTVGVLGCGLHFGYPRSAVYLRDRIVGENGLVISEFEPESDARKYHFLLRNRILAAMSKTVCVIQAGSISGALNTAKWAKELHRDLFVVPAFPKDPAFQGNLNLLEEGYANPLVSVKSLATLLPHRRHDSMPLFARA